MEAWSKSLLIWGAGEHGRVVAEIARAAGYVVAGFADADVALRGKVADAAGARVLLSEQELIECLLGVRSMPNEVDAIVPAVGDNGTRFRHIWLLDALLAPALIHPTAFVSPSAIVQPGSVVGPMAVVNTNARVGRGVIVNTAGIVGHDAVVEDAAHIGAHAVLTGEVQVGERAFVATSASIIPGVRVGADAIVGAGAVVLSNVADGSTVVGVPARPIEVIKNESGNKSNLSLTSTSLGT
ncbi:MAG TPA: NeuD/PglB/VioB family sugar acetyltransferase [Longimicrobiales bacterium]